MTQPQTPTPTTPLPDDPAPTADERTTLVEFLDYFRGVFVRKVEGMDAEQLRMAACPPSDLTPLGMVRHMAEVERWWFRQCLDDPDATDFIFDFSEDEDLDFHPGPDATIDEALQLYHAEVEAGRANLDKVTLEHVVSKGREPRKSVRWVVVHMIEEYARHCGHLDLICQAIDGRTGD